MYRLLIIAGLLVVLYLVVRRAIQVWGQGANALPDANMMVQDPMCKTFVPRGTAVSERIGGQTYYFCSQSCAKQFERQLAG
ncbi:MAG: YHS domain-containing protein [Nitrospiraceae bacterium]